MSFPILDQSLSNSQPFSILMSIYSATQAKELRKCFDSVRQQTLSPNEIILVHDGPVNSSVERCIEGHAVSLPIHQLRFPNNRGLGPALRDGLNACQYDIVARVDSDDWSLPDRFHLQVAFLSAHPQISAVGSWLKEWYPNGSELIAV